MKKCETFGCTNTGVQMYQIAPATNVWLYANVWRRPRRRGAHSRRSSKTFALPPDG